MNEIKFEKIQDFADILHLTKNSLCRMLRYKKYKTFKIKKKNGQYREINSPKFELKIIQKWILINILEKQPLPDFVMAFRKHKNGLKEGALLHKDNSYLLKMDLSDFYPSISFSMVKNMFLKIGFSEFESKVFTHFCTYNNKLPQGGVTSPYISNLIFNFFDIKIKKYADERNIIYTRYADDLIFSSNSKEDLIKIKNFVYILINKYSRFRINKEKTKFFKPSQHKKVTGITINNELIKVNKKLKQDVRMTLYNLFKNNHFEKRYTKEKLIGTISYIHLIEDAPNEYGYINNCIKYISNLMVKNNSISDFGLLKTLQQMK